MPNLLDSPGPDLGRWEILRLRIKNYIIYQIERNQFLGAQQVCCLTYKYFDFNFKQQKPKTPYFTFLLEMSSISKLSYGKRAEAHSHPVAKLFLETAEKKKSNLIISADLTNTAELLACADRKDNSSGVGHC